MRDAIENGWPRPLAVEEHSHAAMANAYEAGAPSLTTLSAASGSRRNARFIRA
jgi:hypothetical protein